MVFTVTLRGGTRGETSRSSEQLFEQQVQLIRWIDEDFCQFLTIQRLLFSAILNMQQLIWKWTDGHTGISSKGWVALSWFGAVIKFLIFSI